MGYRGGTPAGSPDVVKRGVRGVRGVLQGCGRGVRGVSVSRQATSPGAGCQLSADAGAGSAGTVSWFTHLELLPAHHGDIAKQLGQVVRKDRRQTALAVVVVVVVAVVVVAGAWLGPCPRAFARFTT